MDELLAEAMIAAAVYRGCTTDKDEIARCDAVIEAGIKCLDHMPDRDRVMVERIAEAAK